MNEKNKLRLEEVTLEAALLWEDNPRDHDEEHIDQMIESFKQYGFQDVPRFTEEMGVIAGNGRILALMKLKEQWLKSPNKEEIRERFNEGYEVDGEVLPPEGPFIPLGIVVDGDVWKVPVLLGPAFKNVAHAVKYAIDHNNMVIGNALPAGTVAASVWDIEKYFEVLQEHGPTITVDKHDIGFIQSMVLQNFGNQRKEEEPFMEFEEGDSSTDVQYRTTLKFSTEENKEKFLGYLRGIFEERKGGGVTKGDALLMFIDGD